MGRPKGSKNKPKTPPVFSVGEAWDDTPYTDPQPPSSPKTEAKEQGKGKLLVKSIKGEYGVKTLSISKTKNWEGKDCLKGHKIVRNEPFLRISNGFGASDSLLCLEHGEEKGWVS